MATVFFDSEGLLLMDIMPYGTTINSDGYIANLKKLLVRLSRVRRHREKQDVLLLHDNAQQYGDKTNCSNFRGISLLLTSYKILSNILLRRLTPYVDEIIGDHQCGFRRNRSTIDQIFCIRQILEKKWEYKVRTLHYEKLTDVSSLANAQTSPSTSTSTFLCREIFLFSYYMKPELCMSLNPMALIVVVMTLIAIVLEYIMEMIDCGCVDCDCGYDGFFDYGCNDFDCDCSDFDCANIGFDSGYVVFDCLVLNLIVVVLALVAIIVASIVVVIIGCGCDDFDHCYDGFCCGCGDSDCSFVVVALVVAVLALIVIVAVMTLIVVVVTLIVVVIILIVVVLEFIVTMINIVVVLALIVIVLASILVVLNFIMVVLTLIFMVTVILLLR
ncbi:hypothetical protein ANN_22530 [Periplaneta americana]|uniref:Reverse transcriptase domain-containing protein n=1 Tax=Periplaneta americana TaxID=6978 RepID=A0ABQ8S8D7_PERAM|nr:hypothetical protein ANN_22530 [Periplaneta americana]